MIINQIPHAIHSIRPKAQFSVGETYESLEWLDETQTKPTEVEFDEALKTVKAEYDAQEYARNRKAEYDALNQFEMQFDDKKNSTTTWDDAIEAIKTKYPKP